MSNPQPRMHAAGAEITPAGVSFRVWAPEREKIAVVLDDTGEHELTKEDGGYFSLTVPGIGPGARYRFRIDGRAELLPDPASRWQPDGPAGASVVVDPAAYSWRDAEWRGITRKGQVLYEMHIGTFTPEGTWEAAEQHLEKLVALGVTVIELMPVAEFCGRFGWGYDGMLLYAPTRLYGTPDEFRHFVDAAHAAGLGVILDVVYNHLGPGNRFRDFSGSYFTDRYANEWGEAINFDGPDAAGARDYFAENAACWIAEYHLDGLRIDATQSLNDASEEHILTRIVRKARRAAGARSVLLLGENEPQHARLLRPADHDGHGLDALWNDDFHRVAHVALTGRNEAYFHDHRGTPQEFVAATKFGHLFQGQRYDWQNKARGTPSFDVDAPSFVNYLDNHDQIANSGRGLRLHRLGSEARARALTALLLLAPQTPLLFQGQEFWSSSPFNFFADQGEMLDPLIAKGRRDFVAQFPSLKDPRMDQVIATPADPCTFERCKLDWREFEARQGIVSLHRDLIRLRRSEAAIARQPTARRGEMDAAVIGPAAFLLRYFGEVEEDERLLIINLGADLECRSVPDPLFAPPEDADWALIWSSEDPIYGGSGQRPLDLAARFTLGADSALLFAPGPRRSAEPEGDLKAWQESLG